MFARVIGDYPFLSGKLTASNTPNARDLVSRMFTVTTSTIRQRGACEEIAARLEGISSRLSANLA